MMKIFRGNQQEVDLLNAHCHLHKNIDSGQYAAAIFSLIDDTANRISISNVLTKNLV
jgi:hydroxyethylthiazole kinase-like sugar kinase family protein